MQVELQQVVGKGFGEPTGRDVAMDVYFVRVDMRSLGYDQDGMKAVGHIGKQAGACVKFTMRGLSDELCEKIVQEVAKLRKVSTNEAYGVLPPAEVIEDTDDEEDDE